MMAHKFKIILAIIVVAFFVVGGFIFVQKQNHSNETQPKQVLLNPGDFGLTSTAKEVILKRTLTSATFEISPGHFAAVSDGTPLFVYDKNNKLVIAGNQIQKSEICNNKISCFAKSVLSNIFPFVFATSAGPNSPSTLADDNSVGIRTWSNPGNASASDNSYATVTNSSFGTQVTHYLKATNFGFSIPTGATIDGVVVEIERKCSNNVAAPLVACKDATVKLVKGGTISGNSKADTTTRWSLSDAYATYGTSSDLWGNTLIVSDINASNFGAVLNVSLIETDPG